MVSDEMGVAEETSATVLAKKHLHKKLPHISTLEVYDESPIFITVDIAEDLIESVA